MTSSPATKSCVKSAVIQDMLAPCQVQTNPGSIGGLNCPLVFTSKLGDSSFTSDLTVHNANLQKLLGLKSYSYKSTFLYIGSGSSDGTGDSFIQMDEFARINTVKYGLTQVSFKLDNKEKNGLRDEFALLEIGYTSSFFSAQRTAQSRKVGHEYELIFEQCQINKAIVDCQELEELNAPAAKKVSVSKKYSPEPGHP